MERYIGKMLDDYQKSGAVRLHMPANRGTFNLNGSYDITELPFSDDLSNPVGVIALSEQQTAKLFGADFCRYLVNGSTVGILAMVGCARGNVLVQRNSHRSLFSALKLFGKNAYVADNMQGDFLSCPLTLEQIKSYVERWEIGTVILTSPDYFGMCAHLPSIYEYCKGKGVLLFVDGAHGGHHILSPLLPHSATVYSHLAVVSAHKDLGALTQTAIMTGNDKSLYHSLVSNINLFTSSSPSYILLESIERAVVNAFADADAYSQTYKLVSQLKVRTEGFARYKSNDDFTRLVIDASYANASGNLLYSYLCSRNIFAEFSTGNYCVCILSSKDDSRQFDILEGALKQFYAQKNCRVYTPPHELIKFDNMHFMCNNFNETQWVSLDCAAGKICANNIGVSPPCIPVCLAGEEIEQRHIDYLRGKTLYNVFDGRVEVLK